MDPMAILALATAVFLATHYVSSTPLRAGLVRMFGENGYLGFYVAASFATIGWMIWAYAKAPYERLWVGDEFKVWALMLMPVSLVLIACGAMSPNPSAVRQESRLRSLGEPRGILRVTRHPILWGIALFAAIVQGRNQFRFEEIGWSKVLAGLALYFVLVFLHPYLFGATPY